MIEAEQQGDRDRNKWNSEYFLREMMIAIERAHFNPLKTQDPELIDQLKERLPLSDASNAARPRGDRFGAGPVFRPDTLPDRDSLPAVRNRSPSVGHLPHIDQ